MTLSTWPAALPRPTRSGYQARSDDPRQRKAAEIGPPGYRRRYSSVARQVSLAMECNRAQKAVFDLFYEDTTSFGALPFTMPDPTTDGWPMLADDGTPLLTTGGEPILLARQWICLFGQETPQETLRGVTFRITFSVSVMP